MVALVKDRRLSLTTIRQQVLTVQRVLNTADSIKWFFANAAAPRATRKHVLRGCFAPQLAVEICHTLYLLVDYNLFLAVSDILTAITRRIDLLQGVVRGIIYSCVPIGADQLQRIEQKLARRWAKTVQLTPRTDPSLLGGVKVVTSFDIIPSCSFVYLACVTFHVNLKPEY